MGMSEEVLSTVGEGNHRGAQMTKSGSLVAYTLLARTDWIDPVGDIIAEHFVDAITTPCVVTFFSLNREHAGGIRLIHSQMIPVSPVRG